MAKPKVPYSKTDPNRCSYIPDKDLYKRKVGYVLDRQGRRVPKTFTLTHDEHVSRDRAGKLQALWEEQEARGLSEWTVEALELAEAVRTGQKALVLEPHPDEPGKNFVTREDPEEGYLYVTPKFKEVIVRRTEIEPDYKDDLENKVVPVVVRQPGNQPTGTGQSLYGALDAYAAHIRATYRAKTDRVEDSTTTAWGECFAASVLRTKDAIGDMDLSLFGLAEVEAVVHYWKQRPYRKGSQKRIAVDTVFDQVSNLKRFLKWLHKASQWDWRKPADLDFEDHHFRLRRKELMTETEVARAGQGVATFTLDDLCILWRYATQLERYYLLVGLNCAFAEAEHTSLRAGEVFLSEARIKRVRYKSGVYGEFALWPETVSALRWMMGRRQNLRPDDLILVNEQGAKLSYTRISNTWAKVVKRARKDYPTFRPLPFKYLRKTAGQLVQDVSDGEVAAVFMCRGKRVITDDLIDRYTKRPFEKVFGALATVRTTLQPMFDEGPADPFSGTQQSKSYISLGKVKQMEDLLRRGVKKEEIAAKLGVSRVTVYRVWDRIKPRSKTE